MTLGSSYSREGLAGDTRVYQKSYLPYFYSGENEEQEQEQGKGKGKSGEEEKEEGGRLVGGAGGDVMGWGWGQSQSRQRRKGGERGGRGKQQKGNVQVGAMMTTPLSEYNRGRGIK